MQITGWVFCNLAQFCRQLCIKWIIIFRRVCLWRFNNRYKIFFDIYLYFLYTLEATWTTYGLFFQCIHKLLSLFWLVFLSALESVKFIVNLMLCFIWDCHLLWHMETHLLYVTSFTQLCHGVWTLVFSTRHAWRNSDDLWFMCVCYPYSNSLISCYHWKTAILCFIY